MKRKSDEPFLREVVLRREKIENWEEYPFSIPAIRNLESLPIDPKITFLVGENGSGKSTVMEAIALGVGLGPEGGSQNLKFATTRADVALYEAILVVRGARRPRTSFFLRAESFFNVASMVDNLGVANWYGGKSLHEQSHGESFLALVNERFGPDGLYLMDEPEAALSPQRQLALLAAFDRLVKKDRSQLIVATHSPILLAYPGACIYSLDERGIARIEYEKTEHYALTRDFLLNRDRYLRRLSEDE